MTYSFHTEAETEFIEAIAYYERCDTGLGLEFSREIFRAIDLIVELPNAWSSYHEGTRRYLTNKFPYSLIYSHREDEIAIWAVMHQSRAPYYWVGRLD